MAKQKNPVQAARQMELRLIAWMNEDLNEGFGAASETYKDLLTRTAHNVLDDTPRLAHLAEDTVQDGLINALLYLRENPEELERPNFRLRNWLVKIVHNQALKVLAVGKAHIILNAGLLGEEVEDAIEEGYTTHYGDLLILLERLQSEIEAKHTIREQLATLSPEQRTAVEQKYLKLTPSGKEKTYEQIAEILNRPVGTVKSQIHHAKAQMREQIEQKKELSFRPRIKKKTS